MTNAVSPASIITGWDGVAPRNVVVHLDNSGNNDTLTIYDATNTTLLPLGTVSLGGNYVTAARTFGASGTPSTITMSLPAGSNAILTLGTASGGTSTETASCNASWVPSALVTDVAGNAASTDPFVETDNDNDF